MNAELMTGACPSLQYGIGGHVHMRSTLRGEGLENCSILRTSSTDRLRETRTVGVKNPKLKRKRQMYR